MLFARVSHGSSTREDGHITLTACSMTDLRQQTNVQQNHLKERDTTDPSMSRHDEFRLAYENRVR